MRVLRSWLAASVSASALAAGLAGCSNSPTPPGPDVPRIDQSVGTTVDPNPDVGPLLYQAEQPVKVAARPADGGAEPIVVGDCTVQNEERQQVSSEVDAKVELIATPIAAGEKVDPKDVVYHPRDLKKERPYRRLHDGDPVKVGQVLCFLDDQLITTKMEQALILKKAAEEVIAPAKEGVKLSESKYKISLEAYQKGTLAVAELINDQITLSRFLENLAQSQQQIAKASSDYEEARVTLGKYRVVSNVNGFIRSVSKQPGDFARVGEKIMELQSTDQVRVEGNIDAQYAAVITRGMPAIVEPALPLPPERKHTGHRTEVTGVAVTANPGRPLVVSSGADGQAIVWDVTKGDSTHGLPHPVGVRSVACTPPTAQAVRCVTGGDDGRVRVWDLSNPDKLPTSPLKEGTEAHTAGVQAVAFSPDGRHFATAAGREVYVWETDTGRKLYALPAEHRDTVTHVAFTPQCTLVTAAKDRTLKVWKLGADRAAVARNLEHRSGAVDALDVSKDGGRVLFDQDRGRVDVVSLADKLTVGQVQNVGATASFSTVALFSPDDRYIVTAGGEGALKGGLQVWGNPASGRGSEVARLIAPGREAVTCGAFNPVTKDMPFLVAGTANGRVCLWRPPSEGALRQQTAVVTKVDSTDPRYITVRVEMANPKDRPLLDRSTATIILTPGAK